MKALLILLACCLISCEGGYSSYSYQSVPSTTVRTYRSYTPTYYYKPARYYYPIPVSRYNSNLYRQRWSHDQYSQTRWHGLKLRSYQKTCP